MSVQAITWALDQECKTATDKAVLMVVANYVGPDGTTFVGQETIARQACCSIKTVERALAIFESAGWIVRERRHRRDGSRTSDLIISIGPNHPEKRAQDQTDNVSDRQAPNRQPVQTKQTTSPNLPDCVSGLTSFEPLEEPLGEPSPPKRADANARRGSRIAPDWTPSPECNAFAAREGLTPEETARAAAEFRDYWSARPGRDAAKLDWPATWRNRVRQIADRKRPAGAAGGAKTGGHRPQPVSMAGLLAERRRQAPIPPDVPGEGRILRAV
ncbi:MAG: helix-turn-helix domain-containing protein [Alphaproteobacteria bacterium]|nr:MAG: helix-turn-helix domain-containing protein [Alphaproteobacteria bacterium]